MTAPVLVLCPDLTLEQALAACREDLPPGSLWPSSSPAGLIFPVRLLNHTVDLAYFVLRNPKLVKVISKLLILYKQNIQPSAHRQAILGCTGMLHLCSISCYPQGRAAVTEASAVKALHQLPHSA